VQAVQQKENTCTCGTGCSDYSMISGLCLRQRSKIMSVSTRPAKRATIANCVRLRQLSLPMIECNCERTVLNSTFSIRAISRLSKPQVTSPTMTRSRSLRVRARSDHHSASGIVNVGVATNHIRAFRTECSNKGIVAHLFRTENLTMARGCAPNH